ncbi:hypothetical protein ACFOD4_19615, partial [Pseudoroseomonas globiformis]
EQNGAWCCFAGKGEDGAGGGGLCVAGQQNQTTQPSVVIFLGSIASLGMADRSMTLPSARETMPQLLRSWLRLPERFRWAWCSVRLSFVLSC